MTGENVKNRDAVVHPLVDDRQRLSDAHVAINATRITDFSLRP
jgi:hypothetical protein